MFTSASQGTMDQIQSFNVESGGVLVPLGTKVRGNVQVIIHHIRSVPIARKVNLVSTPCVCVCVCVCVCRYTVYTCTLALKHSTTIQCIVQCIKPCTEHT